jgi:transposase-like protein
MSVQNRRKYDSDFKRNAVLLSEEPGRTVPEVAENLGINSDLITGGVAKCAKMES